MVKSVKKIQYYNSRVSNIFPNIMDSGVTSNKAYFDIKYFKNYQNCFEYLNKEKKVNVKKLLSKILSKSKKLYRIKIPTITNNIQLYFEEEIDQRVKILKKKLIKEFFINSHLYYNNEKVLHLDYQLNFLKKFFR